MRWLCYLAYIKAAWQTCLFSVLVDCFMPCASEQTASDANKDTEGQRQPGMSHEGLVIIGLFYNHIPRFISKNHSYENKAQRTGRISPSKQTG